MRPNILWLVSEDNNSWLGCYGDPLARTPNLDALGRKGVIYRNATSTASVCAPSRYAVLTGMHAESNAPAQHMRATAHLPAAIPTYPQLMRNAGYYCTNNEKTDYNCDVDVDAIWDESSQSAHWRGRAKGQPFMAVFNSLTTHERFTFKPTPGAVEPDQINLPGYLPDRPGIRENFASYHNLMEKMDAEFGARLAELEADGLAEDTIVFYYGDNGGTMPRSKHYPWREGFEVPLIVYVPPKWRHLSPVGMGTEVATPVSLLDLAPTVLSLAGLDVPKTMQGQAFLGARTEDPREFTFGARDRVDERDGLVRVAMTERWHYMRTYTPHRPYWPEMAYPWRMAGYQDWDAAWRAGELDPAQSAFFEEQPYEALYDLSADPDQLVNLADDPAYADELANCRDALDRHMLSIRDNGFIPEGSPLEGWQNTRSDANYPLGDIMALARRAASRDPDAGGDFLAAMDHANEVVRYWAAIGLLLAENRSPAADTRLATAMGSDSSVHVRLVAAEALAPTDLRGEAIGVLSRLTGPDQIQAVRLGALNALTFVAGADDAGVADTAAAAEQAGDLQIRNAARFLRQSIEGTYDPHQPVFDLQYFLKNLPKE